MSAWVGGREKKRADDDPVCATLSAPSSLEKRSELERDGALRNKSMGREERREELGSEEERDTAQ